MPPIKSMVLSSPSYADQAIVAEKVTSDKSQVAGRPIIYPKISIKLCDGQRDPFLTATQAKTILGWQVEEGQVKFGNNYLLIDAYGKKVRCWNNLANRPYKPANADLIRQEILRGNWRLNLESMIVGKTGLCISCQHRLIGLILAVQEWEQNKAEWPHWKTEPTMACLIAFGCDEADDTVNTIDTGIPRSLADVVYRSDFFRDLNLNDPQREIVSRMVEYSVKKLWDRMGVENAHNKLRRSHAEALEFIDSHSRLLECVKHIYTENRNNKQKLAAYIPLGYASGLLYLMGACRTKAMATITDKSIDWSAWDMALDFWAKLAQQDASVQTACKMLEGFDSKGYVADKEAVIIKAWKCFVDGEPLTAKSIKPKYRRYGDIDLLVEFPSLGGVDLVPPYEAPDDDGGEEIVDEDGVS